MYKVCLIGYGYWGSKLARNFKNSDYFDLYSVVDNKRKNLLHAKKNFPLIKTYSNYNESIKNNLINLVIISTPTSTHYKIAKYSLENSKHVLIEKPMCLSLKEVLSLNKIAKKNKKMIFVDYPFLFAGTINYIKNIIAKKKYGKIMEIESFREQAPVRKDSNVIWDLGIHDISILTYLLNEQPYKIQTIVKNNFKKNISDTAYINLKYKKSINVLIKNSWVSPTKIRTIKIKFEKAILYCDENESIYKIKIYKNKSIKNWKDYSLELPNIDLREPLEKMTKYIFYSMKNNTNHLFKNNLNEKITSLIEKINKNK
jgi:predicted dehydrogenase